MDIKKIPTGLTPKYRSFEATALFALEACGEKFILSSGAEQNHEITRVLTLNEKTQQKLEKAFNACPDEHLQLALTHDIGKLLNYHKTLAEEPDNLLACAIAINQTLAIAGGGEILDVFL
jgi:hypothetical protein